MKNYINNLIHLPGIYFSLIRNLKYQRRFIKNTLAIDITEGKNSNDSSLDEHDFKKMTDYYGYAVPAVLGESYCILRGRKMTLTERLALTYLGALTGLFDDFFDKKNMSESYIKDLIENPASVAGNNSNEKLFIKFYRKALKNSADADLVKSYFLRVHEAQILSKKQLSTEIGNEEIEQITYFKGGISLLFYRSIFSEEMSEDEINLLNKLGGLMQLENDIFDVYKDYKDGVKTLGTIEKNIDNLRKTYILLTDVLFNLAHQTKFPAKNTTKFLRIVCMVICRGFVCLDMLKKNEKLTNNTFSLESYERKDLICDMEKPINFCKTIHYFAKYSI